VTLDHVILAGLLATAAPSGPAHRDTVPLFAEREPLVMSLVADFEALRSDRAEEPVERPALVVLPGSSGVDTVEAQLRPRGNTRRDPGVCSFPPLRLNLKKRQTVGTVFADQDKLKMVVPCRPERDAYEQYVLLEYLAYRIHGLLTEASFRVRLAHVTFVPTSRDGEPLTRYAFLIEDDDALALRLGGEVLDLPDGRGVRPTALDPREATLNAVFQYMIGNTDWGEDTGHNMELIHAPGVVRAVPFDFDYAGLVDAMYAATDPRLGSDSVRERRFRGWCFAPVYRDAALRVLQEARPAVDALLGAVPGLHPDSHLDAAAYLESFWEDVETPERAERRMYRDCRPLPS
jgi:hypothetical protein